MAEKCPSCGHMEAYSKEMQVMYPDLPTSEEIIVIVAKECRRGLDNNLHGKYVFYCLVGLSLTRWQCVSCKHGWRVNN